MSDDGDALAAGDFSAWLAGMQRALRGEADADVPCSGCTACCRSSQFVHIEPDERETLASIPGELLFPAPGRPAGHVVLGYDERGHCPMLTDTGCSIYATRPRACRAYDCRIFPATGVQPDAERPVALQASRWRFSHPTDADRIEHDAVRAAAARLRADVSAKNPTHLAVLALDPGGSSLESGTVATQKP